MVDRQPFDFTQNALWCVFKHVWPKTKKVHQVKCQECVQVCRCNGAGNVQLSILA